MFSWPRRLLRRAGPAPDSAEDYTRRRKAVLLAHTTDRFLRESGITPAAAIRGSIGDIHDWRLLVPHFLRDASADDTRHIYCFGAAHGHTVSELVAGFRLLDLALPTIHVFDSFAGLPPEEPGMPAAPNFVPGAYACSLDEFRRRVDRLELPGEAVVVHAGWFRDTLRPELIADRGLMPALYVDVDCDLYGSTRDALRFMLQHDLIQPGTLIGYDDWGDSELLDGGESRAHRDIVAEFGVAVTELFSWGEPPLVRKLFRVERVAPSTNASAPSL